MTDQSPPTTQPATQKQREFILAIGREAGLTDEETRAFVEALNQRTWENLTVTEANQVIHDLQQQRHGYDRGIYHAIKQAITKPDPLPGEALMNAVYTAVNAEVRYFTRSPIIFTQARDEAFTNLRTTVNQIVAERDMAQNDLKTAEIKCLETFRDFMTNAINELDAALDRANRAESVIIAFNDAVNQQADGGATIFETLNGPEWEMFWDLGGSILDAILPIKTNEPINGASNP